jgi:hypothetical protein
MVKAFADMSCYLSQDAMITLMYILLPERLASLRNMHVGGISIGTSTRLPSMAYMMICADRSYARTNPMRGQILCADRSFAQTDLFRFTRQIGYWPINRFVGQRIKFGQYSRMLTKGAIFNYSIPITILRFA